MKLRGLKSIDLVLENCEVVNIPIRYIGYLQAENFKRIITINNGEYFDYTVCKSFVIEIFKEIDRDIEYYPFGSQNSDDKESIINRLKRFADITQIEFIYEDKSEHFYVDWDNKPNDEINSYQDTYVSGIGNIYISICKDKKLKDYFDDEDFKRFNDTDFITHRKIEMDINDSENEEITHKFIRDDLPAFYKYVYLHFNNERDYDSIIAVRVPDKDSVYKFIFEPDNRGCKEIRSQLADSWCYPSEKIAKFINEQHQDSNDGFTIKEIMKRFPLVNIL